MCGKLDQRHTGLSDLGLFVYLNCCLVFLNGVLFYLIIFDVITYSTLSYLSILFNHWEHFASPF